MRKKDIEPQVRFAQFKDPWERKALNELLYEAKLRNRDLKYGKDRVLSVSGEFGVVNQIEHLGRSYAGVSVHQYHVVEVGDIVYTKSPLKANPFGIIRLNKRKAGIVSTLYAVYKVNQKTAFGPFIDYYFSLDANTNRYLRPLVKKGAKNDMKINNAYVLHDSIYAPSIPEQQKIASFLSAIDEKIQQLTQKKELLEQYKRGVMQQLFSGKLRFKDENGNAYPKWEESTLGDYIEIVSGYAFKSELFSDNGEVLVTPKNFTKSGKAYFDNNNTKRTEEEVADKFICRPGDLLVLLTDLTPSCELLGKPVLLSKADGNVLLNQRIVKIVESKAKLFKPFLSYFFQTENYHKRIKETSSGTTVRHSSNKVLLTFRIGIPSIEEQQKIANYLTAIDTKIENATTQITQTKTFKKGLLQQMFV